MGDSQWGKGLTKERTESLAATRKALGQNQYRKANDVIATTSTDSESKTAEIKTEIPRKRKRSKLRSASQKKKLIRPFPKVSLAKALEIPYKIRELNGCNPWTPAQIAEAIGIAPSTPDFYYVTAASRDFGLTTGTRDTPSIALTNFGRELVYAPDLQVERAKKIDAFHK